MRFSSKIDLWLWVLMTLTVAVCAAAIVMMGLNGSVSAAFAGMAVCAVVLALPVWVVLRTYYELVESDLLIRSGPFRWCVPLDQIRTVAASRNLASAPALSINRLLIAYGQDDAILISPRDKLPFIEELRRQCPGIEVAAS